MTYDDNNTESSSGALTPQVRYRPEGTQLTLKVRLVEGEMVKSESTLTLPLADLNAAAKQVAEEMIKLAGRSPSPPI